MSDPEGLDFRNLPPVEPVPVPSRLSQSFLRHADRCPRSAYLYRKYRGGAPSHPLDRGSAFHLFAERATNLLLERDEPRLDPDTAKVLVDEVLREHPELTVTLRDADAVRVMAYHWAVGFGVDPSKVVGVERKFVLELGGWTLVGKIDVAALDGEVGQVDDYKTSFNLPSQDEYDDAFQPIFYALLLVFGRPVLEVPGRDDILEPPIGDRVQWVRVRELYPRYLRDDGEMQYRSQVLSRTDLMDFRHDLERLVAKVTRSFQTWEWPAVRGSHCSECPCEAECPLPEHLRRLAGKVNTPEQAAEAAEWVEANAAKLAATRKELKAWAGAPGNGPIRFGADRIYEFKLATSKETDWPALEEGVQRAVLYGEPFELAKVRREKSSTRFQARTLTPGELASEREADE